MFCSRSRQQAKIDCPAYAKQEKDQLPPFLYSFSEIERAADCANDEPPDACHMARSPIGRVRTNAIEKQVYVGCDG